MFRKILIGAIASFSLLAPLAMPAQTEAREVHARRPAHVAHRPIHRNVYHGAHRRAYRVYYRNCGAVSWRFDGSYGRRIDAGREAQMMRARGFEVVIR